MIRRVRAISVFESRRARETTRAAAVTVLLFGLAAGCGDRGPARVPVFPVRGHVLRQGKPAVGALVVLHPDVREDDPMWASGYPRGVVREDGSFAISTYDEADGAPAWQYAVVVTWPVGDADEEGGEEGSNAGQSEEDAASRRKNASPFEKPLTTPVKFKVVEQPSNEIPRIDLP
ncbi:MAG: hypothetical protein FJ297_00105 [Planctomycetes bacterium]|nr:hypothetical protein [Planctomycetota bacterium]